MKVLKSKKKIENRLIMVILKKNEFFFLILVKVRSGCLNGRSTY